MLRIVASTFQQVGIRGPPRASLLLRSTCPTSRTKKHTHIYTCPGLITVRRDVRPSGSRPCTFPVDDTGKSIENAKSLQDDTLLVVCLAVASAALTPNVPIFLGLFPCSQIYPKSPRKREVQIPPAPTLRKPGIEYSVLRVFSRWVDCLQTTFETQVIEG